MFSCNGDRPLVNRPLANRPLSDRTPIARQRVIGERNIASALDAGQQPVPTDEDSLMTLKRERRNIGSESQSSGRKKQVRIVLVEDNSLNRLLLADYLRYCGYQVHEVTHGAALLEVLQQCQPDLMLLDLKLPGLDGYALLEQLRQHPDWRDLPVIVVSALAFQEDQEKAFELGANRYLVKPVKLDYLHQVIQEEYQNIKSCPNQLS